MSEPRTYRALITFGGEDELITLTLDANSEIEGQARDDQQRADALLSAADTALLEACRSHIAELEEAWRRGAITEHDGQGGVRSNRNAALRDRLDERLREVK